AAMSELIYGDRSMRVAYDSGCVQWPLNWYLRNMPNAVMTSDPLQEGVTGTPVIVARGFDGDGCTAVPRIAGYTGFTYVLRWHEPQEQTWRNFAIAPENGVGNSAWHYASQPHGLFDVLESILSSLGYMGTMDGQIHDYRLLMFREMPDGTNGYTFTVFVRNDLLPYYDEVRYGEGRPTKEAADETLGR
ncbi:MAG: hypothetical protein QM589_02905, partial [Thermomicrobiales bacterium]